jgi:hypothetical protein
MERGDAGVPGGEEMNQIPQEWWKCRCGSYVGGIVNKCPTCGFEKSSRQTFADVQGCEYESDLHEQIAQVCREKRWPYVHSRMDAPTTNLKGVADFIIFMPGRVLVIECKNRNGKQSPEQLGWQMMIEAVGHKYHLIRTFEEFSALINAGA